MFPTECRCLKCEYTPVLYDKPSNKMYAVSVKLQIVPMLLIGFCCLLDFLLYIVLQLEELDCNITKQKKKKTFARF